MKNIHIEATVFKNKPECYTLFTKWVCISVWSDVKVQIIQYPHCLTTYTLFTYIYLTTKQENKGDSQSK